MNKLIFVLLILSPLIMGTKCSSVIKYKSDDFSMSSSDGNSPEFPVFMNGELCKDMDGAPGLCSVFIDTELSLVIPKRPYQYKLSIACSESIGYSKSFDVPKNEEFKFTLPFNGRSYTCIGEVFPRDREKPVSAKFEIRGVVK